MEGTCGKILLTEDQEVVIKKVHRRKRAHQRINSLRAKEQYEMQRWAWEKTKGMKLLFVPPVIDFSEHEYKMKKIDVSKPIAEDNIPQHPVCKELQEFYNAGKKEGIYPCDYELYEQADGRVGMIDFDKFGIWEENGSVVYPWGLRVNKEQICSYMNNLLGTK